MGHTSRAASILINGSCIAHYTGKFSCAVWTYLEASSGTKGYLPISKPCMFILECPPRPFVWGCSGPPNSMTRREENRKTARVKISWLTKIARRENISYICCYYLSDDRKTTTMGKRNRQFRYGKLIHGAKAQLRTPSNCSKFSSQLLLNVSARFDDGTLSVPIYSFTWKPHLRENSPLTCNSLNLEL